VLSVGMSTEKGSFQNVQIHPLVFRCSLHKTETKIDHDDVVVVVVFGDDVVVLGDEDIGGGDVTVDDAMKMKFGHHDAYIFANIFQLLVVFVLKILVDEVSGSITILNIFHDNGVGSVVSKVQHWSTNPDGLALEDSPDLRPVPVLGELEVQGGVPVFLGEPLLHHGRLIQELTNVQARLSALFKKFEIGEIHFREVFVYT